MEIEAWRNKELSKDEIVDIRSLLFSLPRVSWALARQFPPLSLVKVNVPPGSQMLPQLVGKEIYAMVVDYGITQNDRQQPFVISAILDEDGHPLLDHMGELQVGVTVPESLALLAPCGQITSEWMLRNFCDS